MSPCCRMCLVGAVVLAGCGGSPTNDTGNKNPPTQPPGTPAQSANVSVQDDFFQPNSVLLAIGGTVTWTWVGDNGHSVTPDGSPNFSPTAPILFPPNTLQVTFATAGTYRYFCLNHGVQGNYGSGQMIGAIYVQQ